MPALAREESPVPASLIITLVGLFLLMDGIVVSALVRACRDEVRAALGPHPARVPGEPRRVRRFSHLSVGMFNFGFSVHLTRDAEYLHVAPTRLARWLGLCAASIPWPALTIRNPKPRMGMVEAALGRSTIKFPAWCLKP